MKPETLALHAGYDGDPTTHAATAPIYQTTSYTTYTWFTTTFTTITSTAW